MNSSTSRLSVLHAEVERLTYYLTALPPEAWHRPSACDQWQVADVVAHLTAGGHAVARSVARGLQGEVGPPAGAPALSAHDEDAHRERMAQSALAHRVQLGAHLLATFITSNEALHQQLAALAPQAWAALCYHPARLMPVHLLVDHRITEVAMHGWDIRAPSDPSTHLAPESFPAFLTIIVERVVTRAFRPDARRARPIGYRFVVTGPLTTTTDILLSADGARVVPTGQAEVDVCFRCEAEPYILVMFGRRPLEAAIATGKVTVEGDHALAIAFGQSFQGGWKVPWSRAGSNLGVQATASSVRCAPASSRA